jgi:tRNA (mo5U34)-methyltransferase
LLVPFVVAPTGETYFQRLRSALGSGVRYVHQSIYAADARELGQFDVVLFLGVLYHLRYPLLAVDRLRALSRGWVYAETHVCDDGPEARGTAPATEIPIWRFYPRDELHKDYSNWFGPNVRAVLDAFETAGFAATCTSRWADRAAFAAEARTSLREALDKTYEGLEFARGVLAVA